MKSIAFLLCAIVAIARPAVADTQLQRYTLIVGANFGGADRPLLKYGVSDAERFARVMVDLGGVAPEHNMVLRQPKLRELMEALDLLTRRVTDATRVAPPGTARIEVIVYYSGHADEKGLLLGEDRYSYRSLRDRLDQIPAAVRIAVLDACASGAFTRIKGGRARAPFLVDESASMRGHAFLTSSAATEVAQESDRIRASYFTHYLVSGLRGAADLSGDGRVSLNEAYQFAFNETLGRTVDSKNGAQHPSYDINIAGTGDVVMTDVRQLSATLVLAENVDGRFFIRNAAQELIAEVYKPLGRSVAFGVEPGVYEVRVEREKAAFVTKTTVGDGTRFVIDRTQFGPTRLEASRARGDVPVMPYAVEGRNRLEMRLGMVLGGTRSNGGSGGEVAGGMRYTRYINESVALTVDVEGSELPTRSAVGPGDVSLGAMGLFAMPVGARWYPLAVKRRTDAVKPFVGSGIGPIIGETIGSSIESPVMSRSHTTATIGGYVRGGADFHLGRSFSLGVDGGYNWMAGFDEPVGIEHNYDGFSIGVGFGWLFGQSTSSASRR